MGRTHEMAKKAKQAKGKESQEKAVANKTRREEGGEDKRHVRNRYNTTRKPAKKACQKAAAEEAGQ